MEPEVDTPDSLAGLSDEFATQYHEERILLTIPSEFPGVSRTLELTEPRPVPGYTACQCPGTLSPDDNGRRTVYVNLCHGSSSIPTPMSLPDEDGSDDGTVSSRTRRGATSAAQDGPDVEINFGCLNNECAITEAIASDPEASADALAVIYDQVYNFLSMLEGAASSKGSAYARKCQENTNLARRVKQLEKENAHLKKDRDQLQEQLDEAPIIADDQRPPVSGSSSSTVAACETSITDDRSRKRKRTRNSEPEAASAPPTAADAFVSGPAHLGLSAEVAQRDRTRVAELEKEVAQLKTKLAAAEERVSALAKLDFKFRQRVFEYRTRRAERLKKINAVAGTIEDFAVQVCEWFKQNERRGGMRYPSTLDDMAKRSRDIMKEAIHLAEDNLPSGLLAGDLDRDDANGQQNQQHQQDEQDEPDEQEQEDDDEDEDQQNESSSPVPARKAPTRSKAPARKGPGRKAQTPNASARKSASATPAAANGKKAPRIKNAPRTTRR